MMKQLKKILLENKNFYHVLEIYAILELQKVGIDMKIKRKSLLKLNINNKGLFA